jgi:signal transduction histidine kinase
MATSYCEDKPMKLWQKIFLPSVAFTMIGIFAISMTLVIRSHTLQLEAERDAILSKKDAVISELEQSVDAGKRGYFLSSSKMEERLAEFSSETTDESMEISITLRNEEPDLDGNESILFSQEHGTIQYQEVIFLSGFICNVSITKNIAPLLERFDADIQTVQVYGSVVAITISLAMLILAMLITRPIKGLEKATEQISVGDYHYRIKYKGNDELAELAQHMNDMASHIEEDTAYIESISDGRRTFIANMTHELKTPLTSILGFADVLRIKSDLSDEERRNYADIIYAEANRLRTLSSRLMELITVDEIELHLTTVDLADLLMREVEMYRPICEKTNISLVTELEPAVIQADETLFATMIVNLIDNARKASAPGKEIYICSQKRTHHVLIQVKDHGIGIPKEQIPHVTEAFYMVDKARTRKAGGAGIGLALCKAIVSAHHGELSIESEPGEGTTVTVSVPLSER